MIIENGEEVVLVAGDMEIPLKRNAEVNRLLLVKRAAQTGVIPANLRGDYFEGKPVPGCNTKS